MIGIVAILLLGVALSLDTFAVSVTLGACCNRSTSFERMRFLILMGLFHVAMILIGWLCGNTIHRIIESFDHWIAFGLLAFLGVKMIIESFSSNEEPPKSTVLSLQNTLLLCVADSIDALATGFSLSMQSVRIGIVWAALIIGFLAFLISGLGIQLGRYFSSKLGAKATLVGGIILIVIGARILIEHTM